MPKIIIRNLNNKHIDVNDGSQSILDALLAEPLDWMHACGGNGRCTTCKMVMHSGQESLGSDSEAEAKLRDLGRLADNERLACQCSLNADIEISVAEKNKFPHVAYSD